MKVYEQNAKLCLEGGDFAEFDVCQSLLFDLYQLHPASPNRIEFITYRLLFDLMNRKHGDFTATVRFLSRDEMINPAVCTCFFLCLLSPCDLVLLSLSLSLSAFFAFCV